VINSSLSSSVKVAPLPKNEYDFAVSMQHRLNTPIQVHSVAKPDGSKLAILNDRRVSVCFACSKYYQGPHSSREVGIRFTQVAPICSVRDDGRIPRNLTELEASFGAEEACRAYLALAGAQDAAANSFFSSRSKLWPSIPSLMIGSFTSQGKTKAKPQYIGAALPTSRDCSMSAGGLAKRIGSGDSCGTSSLAMSIDLAVTLGHVLSICVPCYRNESNRQATG